jgi:archaemetzincin
MAGIDLVPIYLADRLWLVEELVGHLHRAFRSPVRIRTPWFDPEHCFDSSRSQYNSTLFLRELLNDENAGAHRVLGVTSVDLFIPVLTYVFGEAQVEGRAAVVSIHRLRNEVYGLSRDDVLLADRLKKESTHELGHTFGLIHCPDSACVMRASTYVEEIDLKPAAFCESCLRNIHPG